MMRNTSNRVSYYLPESLPEVMALVKNKLDYSFIAGGTDIMVNKQQGNFKSDCLIDLGNIPELRKMEIEADYYKIGGATILSDIIADKYIQDNFPLVTKATKSIASPLIRNQATIAGNLLVENRCIFYNQSELWREAAGYCLKCGGTSCLATGGGKTCLSKFVSDLAPALISLNACVVLINSDYEKTFPLEELYTNKGINSKNIDKNTILKSILLPLRKNIKSSFKKLRQRKTLEFTSLTVAATRLDNNDIIIAISGAAPGPIVLKTKKGDSFENIYSEINKKSKIINNDFFDRKYRKDMLKTYLADCLKEIET
jgi:4-hydroxybenzoyl-CoA reductase subunit beta